MPRYRKANDWSMTSRADMKREILSWLEQAQLALLREYKSTGREDFDHGAHYIEMVRYAFEEKLGTPKFDFVTKDLGL